MNEWRIEKVRSRLDDTMEHADARMGLLACQDRSVRFCAEMAIGSQDWMGGITRCLPACLRVSASVPIRGQFLPRVGISMPITGSMPLWLSPSRVFFVARQRRVRSPGSFWRRQLNIFGMADD